MSDRNGRLTIDEILRWGSLDEERRVAALLADVASREQRIEALRAERAKLEKGAGQARDLAAFHAASDRIAAIDREMAGLAREVTWAQARLAETRETVAAEVSAVLKAAYAEHLPALVALIEQFPAVLAPLERLERASGTVFTRGHWRDGTLRLPEIGAAIAARLEAIRAVLAPHGYCV